MSSIPPQSLNGTQQFYLTDASQLTIWRQSATLTKVLQQLEKAGERESTVMVVGEPGTGRRFAAHYLHASSLRSTKPLLCMGAELRDASRLVEERGNILKEACLVAQGGTIYLEEIDELPLSLQNTLLPFLTSTALGNSAQQMSGAASACACENVRFIASSSQPLAPYVKQRSFSAELYFHLHVLTINLPPLRERCGDIPALIDFYLHELCNQMQRPLPRLQAELIHYLVDYPWPGNMLQLHNCLEHMLVFQRGPSLSVADLPRRLQHFSPVSLDKLEIPAGMSMQQIQDQAISQTLQRVGDNKEQAARVLGLSLRTIQRWAQSKKRRSNASLGQPA